MTFWFLIGSDVQLKQGAESDVSCATIRGRNVRNLMMDSPLRGTYWRNSENVRGSKHMYFDQNKHMVGSDIVRLTATAGPNSGD